MNSEANGFVIMPNQADLLVNDDIIRSRIFTLRGVQVILDRDLAMLYGVDVKRINEQVKRNIDRFPEDFMFRLTKDECLRSQIATLNMGRGKHIKYMPYAFTESGVAMLSGMEIRYGTNKLFLFPYFPAIFAAELMFGLVARVYGEWGTGNGERGMGKREKGRVLMFECWN